jgi:hypothetical protein
MRSIASALPANDSTRKVLARSATAHAQAALPFIASGNYEGEHWLRRCGLPADNAGALADEFAKA